MRRMQYTTSRALRSSNATIVDTHASIGRWEQQ